MLPIYEKHYHSDPVFPFFFHVDTLKNSDFFHAHWHESVEILVVCEGMAQVSTGESSVTVGSGETAFISSDCLHSVRSVTELCRYYCLIVDKSACDELGIDVSRLVIPAKISDKVFADGVSELFSCLPVPDELSKISLRLRILLLFTELIRSHGRIAPQPYREECRKKTALARGVITYINENVGTPFTTREICRSLGFSESYLCHCFRQITGQTVTDYLNYRRVTHARRLLISGQCNVGETSQRCGFENVSYFTKVYKKYFGVLPSSEISRK